MLLRATGSMNLHRVYSLQFTVYSLQSLHVNTHHTHTFILSLVSGDILDYSATCPGALLYIIHLFAKLVSRLSPSKILALVNKLSQQTLSFS